MQELKSAKMIKFVALAIIAINRLGEDFGPLVESARKVRTMSPTSEKEMVGQIIEGFLLAIEAAIAITSTHAELVPEKKEELMQQAWRLRSFSDTVSKMHKKFSENGTISVEETMAIMEELKTSMADAKVVKIEEVN